MAILFNKNAYLSPIGTRVIVPGKNVIPDAELEQMKDIPFVKDQFNLGKWTVESSGVELTFDKPADAIPDTEEDAMTNTITEIVNMDTKVAVKTIIGEEGKDGILDIRVLEELKKVDTRKGVQKAIDAQITFLTEVPEEKEEA